MKIKLNVGEVIKKPIKDTFILHVKSMSGDADAYHTNLLYFDNSENPKGPLVSSGINGINVFLEYFAEYSKLEWNAQCDLRDGVLEHPSLKRFSNIKEHLEDLIGSDFTWIEHYARPDSIWVTYVDLLGDEHCVNIEIDGIVYPKIYRAPFEKTYGTV